MKIRDTLLSTLGSLSRKCAPMGGEWGKEVLGWVCLGGGGQADGCCNVREDVVVLFQDEGVWISHGQGWWGG